MIYRFIARLCFCYLLTLTHYTNIFRIKNKELSKIYVFCTLNPNTHVAVIWLCGNASGSYNSIEYMLLRKLANHVCTFGGMQLYNLASPQTYKMRISIKGAYAAQITHIYDQHD